MIRIVLALVLLFPPSYAARLGQATIEGTIHSFDEYTVTLEQKGQKFDIPRAFIPKDQKLISGQVIKLTLEPIKK